MVLEFYFTNESMSFIRADTIGKFNSVLIYHLQFKGFAKIFF